MPLSKKGCKAARRRCAVCLAAGEYGVTGKAGGVLLRLLCTVYGETAGELIKKQNEKYRENQ